VFGDGHLPTQEHSQGTAPSSGLVKRAVLSERALLMASVC
jgi:hypothetical protein